MLKAIKIIIPDYLDSDKVKQWIGKGDVFLQANDGATYCVMTRYPLRGNELTHPMRFLRFFSLGKETHVSVDWDSDTQSIEERLFDLLSV